METELSWTVPVVLFLMSLLLLYLYGTWPMSTWKQLGIPGPAPAPFVGNTIQIRKKGMSRMLLEWSKSYGKVYGIYMFRRPLLMTTDLDILREVLIKDFGYFNERATVQPLITYPMSQSVLRTSGDVWRRQRHTMTPTFSVSKLKQMNAYISRCCTNLVRAIHTSTTAGTPLDVKRAFGCYTLDIIAGTGFGFETNCLEEKDNVFLNSMRDFFGRLGQNSPAAALASVLPVLEPVFMKLGIRKLAAVKEVDFFLRTIRTVIEERKKATTNGKRRVDLLQLMLDAEASDKDVAENPHDKGLTRDEILAQGFIFFIAGYETTATTLQYLSYLLAMNPDKQEKLYDEIISAIGDAEPCYENVSDIPYLDSCIREALRYFPPVPMFGRRAAETRTIKGVTIPGGCYVMASVYGLTRDEDYFPEPEKFIPERFEAGNKEKIPTLLKEIVFGAGPRQCIGMRLALYEAKMAVVSVVRKVKFLKIKETPEVIHFRNSILSAPDKPILVGTQLRE